MLVKAYAKINLSLDVIGKREDGYHLLRMIMQTIDLYDVLRIYKAQNGIHVSCNKNYVPCDSRNLAYKAAELFINRYDIKNGVNIRIVKNIPTSAGLAGGSADAAAVLKAMKYIYAPGIHDSELLELALKIGADVPYCIIGGTALCEGIGELVTPLAPFKDHILILVKPSFGVSTKEVYRSLDIHKIIKHPDTKLLIDAVSRNRLALLSKNMKNVLENVTLKDHFILREIKEQLIDFGALGAMMSGSGPSIFAFFDDMLKAQNCYDKMKTKYRETFITRTI
ncbi:4-(cytidine 5'-diphospho)-2-C-methyl-D-erythritol kinase [Clostridium luticellarii]|jgi:4-diphosphocytidyl-2-C-methyl-D-erythritol kinase|uniref:4-diphosphocytidyl-2-C-methyl-D-erythritol kinase n=1 Tax=Clostridium luticellarii TaxID=1691940 RepID=A0A2T0BBA1_9CLOT|nr:4-(cytidine 5'-diphospho)-2-C-methyl-D-erythritol kinase [Clostridium luticellarii]MCI1945281.1 4-(cytidine 5'-diphospho)-2-C-methyl-D-erythritol kinase [Clostridium luticellarii]MCI1968658.1 4-(cytidine 5'-diphospho)-2-C-methyl-D-erythritol kinase [Clostridium luticellarii]MCI1995838.1 4-(cytidine 5'-diphospho)-2-C-methyl-D-erythritol kinase [Clostridium luticellarii]MCI2040132.1 4-(cytidine 5'-diphospho)-2-C-methyl-D-erythritol kinase [Clostridium luticellarii]PRR81113.1 4-diphosphocytidy